MKPTLFDEALRAASRHENCDPSWLRKRKEPKFEVRKAADSSGPEVLLLHGLLGALSNWDSVFPLLTSFSNPTAFSFPLLSAHRSEVKVKALALLTEYYIRKFELGPVVLCGNSLGGHVALRMCLASAELVDCLILAGTSGLYEHTVDTLPVRPNRNFVEEHMRRVFFSDEFVTKEAVDEILDVLSSRVRTLNLIHAARSAKRDNLEKLLPQIKVPTLLLWGEDDHITTMDVARTFHRLIPNSELVTIKNCGHAPMIEHPKWFADECEKFLRTHSRWYRENQ